MWVAISQRSDKNKHGDRIDSLENSYVNYLEQFGMKLVVIPNITGRVREYFENIPISGVVLSGGNDIDPVSFGDKPNNELSLAPARDKVEKELLDIAVEKKLPVLGICRGMQFINIYFGGKLIDIRKDYTHPPRTNHLVTIQEADSLGKEFMVNSYHNFGITMNILSSSLKPFALSPEGMVEGFYHSSLPIAGIVWHPERTSPDEEANKKLITDFVNKELFWK